MDGTTVDKFLTDMTEMLKNAKDFALEQLPIVAQEILKYNMAVSIVWSLVGATILAITSRFHIKTVIPAVTNDRDYAPLYIFVIVGYIVGSLVFLLNLMEVLKITLAPRVYLLEYMASLLALHK